MFTCDGEVCSAELTVLGRDDFCAEDGATELHTVADAEDGDAEVENLLVAFDCVFVIDACGAA